MQRYKLCYNYPCACYDFVTGTEIEAIRDENTLKDFGLRIRQQIIIHGTNLRYFPSNKFWRVSDMKKIFSVLIIICLIFTLSGCNTKKESFPEGQQKAIENSTVFIKNSAFSSKGKIDYKVVKIENAVDKTWESVWNDTHKIEESMVDSTDWVITIGEISGHDFAVIVCDSETYEVLGYIPIQ